MVVKSNHLGHVLTAAFLKSLLLAASVTNASGVQAPGLIVGNDGSFMLSAVTEFARNNQDVATTKKRVANALGTKLVVRAGHGAKVTAPYENNTVNGQNGSFTVIDKHITEVASSEKVLALDSTGDNHSDGLTLADHAQNISLPTHENETHGKELMSSHDLTSRGSQVEVGASHGEQAISHHELIGTGPLSEAGMREASTEVPIVSRNGTSIGSASPSSRESDEGELEDGAGTSDEFMDTYEGVIVIGLLANAVLIFLFGAIWWKRHADIEQAQVLVPCDDPKQLPQQKPAEPMAFRGKNPLAQPQLYKPPGNNKWTQKLPPIDSPSSRSSSMSSGPGEQLRSEQLDQLERIAVRVAGKVAVAESKDGFVAAVPAIDQNSEDTTSSKLKYWRDGMLAWWLRDKDFESYIRDGTPAPIGSVPLMEIVDAKRVKHAPEQVYIVRDTAATKDSPEYYFTFATETRAVEWIGSLSRLLTKLG